MRIGLRSGAILALLLLAALPVRAADDTAALDAPPVGLVPTTVHLSAILAAHAAAVGTPSGADTVIEDWRYTDSGISGTVHLERSGTNYHSRITRGPFVEEFGQDNGERWHRDYNGFVVPVTSIDEESFIAERVEEDAADPKNDATVAGVTQGPKPSYVVRVTVDGERHPEWIFYDVAGGLITRVERVVGKTRIATTFDDFRTTGGVTTAWHLHDAWDPSVLDDDFVRTAMQTGIPVDEAQFAQPASKPNYASYQQPVNIPAHFYDDGTIILRMTVNGRGLDMMLDTSQRDNVIDEDVARQLNLPTFGQIDRLPSGEYVAFETLIPSCSVGPMVETNLPVLAEPFNFQWTSDTKVVGILGYDFLANNVLKIDYMNGRVDIMPAASFDGSTPVPGGINVPMQIDDGVPFVQVGLGDAVSQNAVLANEFDDTVVFGDFVADHNDALTNYGNGRHYQAQVPFADNGSFGHEIDVWYALVSHLRFGAADYQHFPVIATNYPLDFSSDRSIDAYLGHDVLRFFDLYIDYPHGRFIVRPNALFFKVFHANH
jgi:hypothetical protein